MKVVVKYTFRDKDNFDKVYNVGDVIDCNVARAANLKKRGLVEDQEPKLFTSAEETSVETPSESPTARRYGKRNKE